MKKILVVGAGSIGRRHIVNLKESGIEYIAVADTRADRREQAVKTGAQKVFQDYREALAGEQFDAVMVTVPPHLHTQVALMAARQGCHLFIEKPLAVSEDGLEGLAGICAEKKLICFVAYCYRFIPSVMKVKELLQAGRVGRVLAARLEFSTYLPDWHPWEDYRTFYMAKKEQGGGALLDESHGIDLLRWLLGEIREVQATVGHVSDLEITSDDLACLLLRLDSGGVASAHFDLLGRSARIQLEIIGSSGTILWDRVEHKVQLYDAEQKRWEVYLYTQADLLSMYNREVEHFIHCVRGGKAPLIDLADGRRTMRVLLAAFESSESGRMVCLS